jgi:hypothetical protein
MNHYKTCAGSICLGDKNPNWMKETIWCPGEPACQRMTTKIIQKINRINAEYKKGKFQDLEGMNFEQLSRSSL